MINLKDEKTRYYYMGKCCTGLPIDFYKLNLYQLKVTDVFEMGEDNYWELLKPFTFSIDIIQDKIKTIPKDMNMFEFVMLDEYFRMNFYLALCCFLRINIKNIGEYKTKNKLNSRERLNVIIKDNEGNIIQIIDDNNFEELCNLIVLMCSTRKITLNDIKDIDDDEEDIVGIDERANQLIKDFFEEKRKHKQITKTSDINVKLSKIYNIYNYVVHSQQSLDYEKVNNMTIYQLYNSYKNINIKGNNDFMLSVASNGLLDSKTKIKNLNEEISE